MRCSLRLPRPANSLPVVKKWMVADEQRGPADAMVGTVRTARAEDRMRRAELRDARGRVRRRGTQGATPLREVRQHPARGRRRDHASAGDRPRRLGGRTGGRDRRPREPRTRGRGHGRDRRIHLRERRQRPRRSILRRTMVSWQEHRRLLPRRPDDRCRRRPRHERPSRHPATERRGAAGRAHERSDLHDPGARQLHLRCNHARARRPDPHRDARRRRRLPEHKVSMQDGDVVEVEIEGIGVLRNEVRTASRDL